MGASELQAVLAVGGGAGVFSPSTRTKSASFVVTRGGQSAARFDDWHADLGFPMK